MKVSLDQIRDLIAVAKTEPSTGDDYADGLYEYVTASKGYSVPYYKLFYLIAVQMKPQYVVELGSWRGVAAAHFAAGGVDEVLTADCHVIHDDAAALAAVKEVAQHYLSVSYIQGWTYDAWVVRGIARKDHHIDVLFMDATHRYADVRRELELYVPLLSDEALIVMDDIVGQPQFAKDMRDAWAELPHEKFLDDSIHGNGKPMGFVRFVR